MKMKNIGFLATLVFATNAATVQADIIVDGNFDSGLDVDTQNFNQNFAYLDVTDERIKRHSNNSTATVATLNGGWFTSDFGERWVHDATGGVGGTGAMFSTNNGNRSFGQFTKDGGATTGAAMLSIDLSLTAINDSVKVQIYGFDDNPGDQATLANRRPGMNLRNEYGMDTLGATEIFDIDVSGNDFSGTFQAGTWQSYDLGSSANDLGFTYYAIYIGATESGVGVDNLTVTATAVPEPSSLALVAVALGTVVTFHRRKSRNRLGLRAAKEVIEEEL